MTKAIPVELPPGELISPAELAVAIVNAQLDVKTAGLTGLECIAGKQVVVTAAKFQKFPELGLNTEDDGNSKKLFLPTVDDAEPPGQQELQLPKSELTQDVLSRVSEDDNSMTFPLPYALTDDDRLALGPLLSQLPPLKQPMTDGAISRFLDAYLALPQRPSWIPLFVTNNTIDQRLKEQKKRIEGHMKAMRQEIEIGGLNACDGQQVPTRSLLFNTMIPRSDAVRYVERCGLSVREVELHLAIDNGKASKNREEGIYTVSGVQVNRKENSEPYRTDELEAIEEFVKKLNPTTGKQVNTQKKAADLIGVTQGRITQLLHELAERRKQEKNKPVSKWDLGQNRTLGTHKK